jgi:hypothetical protein
LGLPQIKPIRTSEDVDTVLTLIAEEKSANKKLDALKANLLESFEKLMYGTEERVDVVRPPESGEIGPRKPANRLPKSARTISRNFED